MQVLKAAIREIKWWLWVLGVSGWIQAVRDAGRRADSGTEPAVGRDTDHAPIKR